jgi:3',5'-nucleoside bisphosphate phosphatase
MIPAVFIRNQLKEKLDEKQEQSGEGWADLHVHTSFSDGLLSPSEMVGLGRAEGLRAVGIADHDTIDGIGEAVTAGALSGLEVVPGVELSSQYNGKDVHIIGYDFDPGCRELAEHLQIFRDERFRRAEKIVRNLNHRGVDIRIEEVEERSRGRCIGRPHIAEVLMEKGYVETIQSAFNKYIGYGSESYEEKYKLPPEEAIRLITAAKGLSFLAHPGSAISETVITNFVKSGLDGIEVVHPFLSPPRRKQLVAVALKLGMLMSGGSDCHGGRDGQFLVGRHRVPYGYVMRIREAHRLRYGAAGAPEIGFPEPA